MSPRGILSSLPPEEPVPEDVGAGGRPVPGPVRAEWGSAGSSQEAASPGRHGSPFSTECRDGWGHGAACGLPHHGHLALLLPACGPSWRHIFPVHLSPWHMVYSGAAHGAALTVGLWGAGGGLR